MKALIIYESVHHGNTRKIAEAMADALGAKLERVSEAKASSLEDCDVVGFGSGIFYGKHHRRLAEFVERLDGGQDRAAFIFSTSGSGRADGHRALRELLGRKGFEFLGEFSCKGHDTFGPFRLVGGLNKGKPDERDIAEARRFAEGVRRRLERDVSRALHSE
jgi:flavodoxin